MSKSQLRCKAGFTLVELILTLALAVVLMSLLGGALSFYAEKLDARDSETRRLQLAQAILDMIGDDLRVALYPPEFDDEAFSALLASAAGGGGGAQPGQGEDLSAAGLDDLSGDSGSGSGGVGSDGGMEESEMSSVADEPVESTDLSTGTASTSRPGLLGNQTQIQFDVSRLPRLEEYQRQMVGDTIGEIIDVPSDIKTISYFIQPAGGSIKDPLSIVGSDNALSLADATGANAGGGLVRRALDRAVTTLAMSRGGMTTLSSTGDLLATEVVGLQFRYWDGLIWQTYWDSDEFECLPMAIEVTLTMLEPSAGSSSDLAGAVETREYVQIMRLPMGKPVDTSTDLSAAGL